MKRALILLCAAVLAGCTPAAAPDDIHIGYVEADWRYVAAPDSGWIIESAVEPGDRVNVGDLLFRLDWTAQQAVVSDAEARILQAAAQSRDSSTGARTAEILALQAGLDEARARAEEAVAERARTLQLVEKKVASQAAGDRAEADFKTAEAAVKAAEQAIAVARLAARPAQRDAAEAAIAAAEATRESAQYRLDQRDVTAGASGRVEDVFRRPGEYVTPGTPVIALLPDDGLKVRFFVPQAELPALEVGKAVRVRADGLAEPVEASISYIAATAEFTPPVIYSRDARQKLVFVVEAHLPAGMGLHPGLPVEVSW
jgi:HlyD family secretion protein